MKKWLCVLLAASFLFCFSACSNSKSKISSESQPASSTSDGQESEGKYTSVSKTYAMDLVNGSYQDVADHFDSTLKSAMSADVLKLTWEASISSVGNFVNIQSTTESPVSGYINDMLILYYQYNGVKLELTYDSAGKLAGFHTFPYKIPASLVSNDVYEERAIQVGDSSHPLDGILTVPKNVTNPPVAVLIQGSGQSDMDEQSYALKPFQDIARGLAEKGIATIRYNKRYYQYAELATTKITVQDEVLDDAASAIALVKASDAVNPQKIYVIGHSLGGMLVPKIAEDNKDVAGIVSLAGSPRKLEDIIVDQDKKAGATDDQMKTVTEQAQQIKSLTGNEDVTLLGANSHYWYSLNQIDTGSIAQQLTIPMLFLQGSDDFQVYPDVDFAQWKSLLGSKSNVTFHEYDHLNHFFMQSNGITDIKDAATAYDTEEHVESNVIADIADFINAK